MSVKERISKLREKPFRVICLEGDYSASFVTSDAAFAAKERHQSKYPTHEVVVTTTVIIE